MIWLSQWLCPRRHCSIGLAWNDTSDTSDHVERSGEELFTSGVLTRRCGICGGKLAVTHSRSRFATMDEARPALEQLQQEQFRTRQVLQAYGLTYESMHTIRN